MLPPGVQLTVRSRRRLLAQRAHGRVLDLGGAESHSSLWNRPAITEVASLDGPDSVDLDSLVAGGERFDTIFSVFFLVGIADFPRRLADVRQLLTDDGRLLFLEPGSTGALRRTRRLAAPSVKMATGWNIDRDVVPALRTGGLSVIDLERHRSMTVQWWLRTLVEGAAHRSLAEERS